MKLFIEEPTQNKFVFLMYKDGDPVAVNYKYGFGRTAKDALTYIGNKYFTKTDPITEAKVVKLKQLSVSYFVLTDFELGRKITKMDMEDFLEQYGSKQILDLWNETESI